MPDSQSNADKLNIPSEIHISNLMGRLDVKAALSPFIAALLFPMIHSSIIARPNVILIRSTNQIADSRTGTPQILEIWPGTPSIVSIGHTGSDSLGTQDHMQRAKSLLNPDYDQGVTSETGPGGNRANEFKEGRNSLHKDNLNNSILPSSVVPPLNNKP